jgi:hypothetical protein
MARYSVNATYIASFTDIASSCYKNKSLFLK